MGLLDDLLAGALGSAGAQQHAAPASAGGSLLDMAMQFVARYPGGLPALLSQLGGAGLGAQTRSWVGTGANMPVSPEDLLNALGHGQVAQMGQQFGVDQRTAAGGLAALLPELVNQLTPQGHVEPRLEQAQGDELASLLNGLRGNFG